VEVRQTRNRLHLRHHPPTSLLYHHSLFSIAIATGVFNHQFNPVSMLACRAAVYVGSFLQRILQPSSAKGQSLRRQSCSSRRPQQKWREWQERQGCRQPKRHRSNYLMLWIVYAEDEDALAKPQLDFSHFAEVTLRLAPGMKSSRASRDRREQQRLAALLKRRLRAMELVCGSAWK